MSRNDTKLGISHLFAPVVMSRVVRKNLWDGEEIHLFVDHTSSDKRPKTKLISSENGYISCKYNTL